MSEKKKKNQYGQNINVCGVHVRVLARPGRPITDLHRSEHFHGQVSTWIKCQTGPSTSKKALMQQSKHYCSKHWSYMFQVSCVEHQGVHPDGQAAMTV